MKIEETQIIINTMMEPSKENSIVSTQSGTSLSDYNMIFVTHLATLIGTGFTCVGFPLISATVLSCAFNLLAAVSSLLLSILIGWDALSAADYYKRAPSNSAIKYSVSQALSSSSSSIQSVINSSDYSKTPAILSFFEEMDLISTSFVKSFTNQDNLEEDNKEYSWVNFVKGIHSIEEALTTPIYYNSNGHKCLTIRLAPLTNKGIMSYWKQEVCTSVMGRNILSSTSPSSLLISAKKTQQKVSRWLLEHNLLESQLSIFQGTYLTQFYQDISIPMIKCLLTQTKQLLNGENEISDEIINENGIIFITSKVWKDS